MDFTYLFFLAAFLPIKHFMEFQRQRRARRLELPEGIIKTSYRYARGEDEDRACNIYKPDNGYGEQMPLIIDIHGGCWIHGDKDVYDCFNYKLVQKGNVVSTLTYRTADKVGLKEQVQDIFLYLHYLVENQKELGISTENTMLTGDSAGAQLSLLVTAVNQSSKLQEVFEIEPVPIQFRALALSHSVCFVDRAADLFRSPWLSQEVAVPGLLKLLYGHQFENEPVYQNSVTPEKFIDENVDVPPIMLITSSGDRYFRDHTFWLANFFDQLHIRYQLYVERDRKADHIFNILNPFAHMAEKCNQALVDFFHRSIEQTQVS